MKGSTRKRILRLKCSRRQEGIHGKAIVIASGKGGTGKTMFAANLGTTLAGQGHKVVLIDLDTGLRNLDLYLGIENNIVYDVNDVLPNGSSMQNKYRRW